MAEDAPTRPGHRKATPRSRFYGYYGTNDMEPVPETEAFKQFTRFCRFDRKTIEEGNSKIGCLADLIVLWLTRGDAVEYCPTFEHYLRVVLQIVAVWSCEEERRRVYSHIINDIPARDAEDYTRESDYLPEPLPTICRTDSTVDIWSHPAFRKETFKYAQFTHTMRPRA